MRNKLFFCNLTTCSMLISEKRREKKKESTAYPMVHGLFSSLLNKIISEVELS